MRLDLILKETRLIKRRTIAKEICDAGKVEINGKTAKPSAEVKENDILTLHLGLKIICVRINYIQQGRRIIPTYTEVNDNEA